LFRPEPLMASGNAFFSRSGLPPMPPRRKQCDERRLVPLREQQPTARTRCQARAPNRPMGTCDETVRGSKEWLAGCAPSLQATSLSAGPVFRNDP
jgi:hypothetical protein